MIYDGYKLVTISYLGDDQKRKKESYLVYIFLEKTDIQQVVEWYLRKLGVHYEDLRIQTVKNSNIEAVYEQEDLDYAEEGDIFYYQVNLSARFHQASGEKVCKATVLVKAEGIEEAVETAMIEYYPNVKRIHSVIETGITRVLDSRED